MTGVIPSIFSHYRREFDLQLQKLSFARALHVDIMDGKFVKDVSISLRKIPHTKHKFLEAHLMTREPWKYIPRLAKKGFSKMLFHVEGCKNEEEVKKTLLTIRKFKMKAFLALNASTPLSKVERYLTSVDGVLVMGIEAGKEHQKFVPSVYGKIKRLKKRDYSLLIQVDGGVNLDTASRLAKCGVDLLTTGSFVHDSREPREAFEHLARAFEKEKRKK
jgi:ribulose-phosphate 3-epimerase